MNDDQERRSGNYGTDPHSPRNPREGTTRNPDANPPKGYPLPDKPKDDEKKED